MSTFRDFSALIRNPKASILSRRRRKLAGSEGLRNLRRNTTLEPFGQRAAQSGAGLEEAYSSR